MTVGQAFINVCKDPFGAPPAGIADDFSAPTCPLKLRSAHYIQTNTLGHCAFVISPVIDGGAAWAYANTATATASDTISAWVGADHGDLAALSAAYTSWRPVSLGVKAYYVGPQSTTAGIMTVAPIQGLSAPITQLPTSITELADLPGAVNVAAATMTEPLVCIANMFDRVGFALLGSGNHAYTMPSVVIALTGGLASTNVLRVEVSMNCEYLPLYSNIVSSQAATPQGTSSSAMDTVRRLGAYRIGSAKAIIPGPSTTVYSGSASFKKRRAPTASNKKNTFSNNLRYSGYVRKASSNKRKAPASFSTPVQRWRPSPRYMG